jgi:hypothetical protein
MSALSSTVVLPLCQTPSIAGEVNAGCSRPDLAERFEGLYARWKDQRDQECLETDAFEKARREGWAFEFSDPELAKWSEINADAGELINAITTAPARTWADVVLQARACALESNIDWLDPERVENADPSAIAYRRLVDNILAMAGAEAFPGISTVPIAGQSKDQIGRS